MHPAIAQALAPFAPPQSEVQMIEYKRMLDELDWQYQFCDDHSKWTRGASAVSKAQAMQQLVDPDGSIWLSHPKANQFGAPQPIIKEKT